MAPKFSGHYVGYPNLVLAPIFSSSESGTSGGRSVSKLKVGGLIPYPLKNFFLLFFPFPPFLPYLFSLPSTGFPSTFFLFIFLPPPPPPTSFSPSILFSFYFSLFNVLFTFHINPSYFFLPSLSVARQWFDS